MPDTTLEPEETEGQLRSRVIDAEELDDWMILHPTYSIHTVIYVGDGNVLVMYTDMWDK